MAAPVLGVLGQVVAGTTATQVCTPSATTRRQTLSTIVIANTSSSTVTFTLYIRKAGAAAASSNTVLPNITLNPSGQTGSSIQLTWGIALDGGAGDAVSILASVASSVTCTAMGIEEDIPSS